MRANAQGLPRMDAVMYLSSALEAYHSLDPEGQKQLLAEVAAVGQKGLAINNPDQKHQLRLYQGGATVSASRLPASFMWVCSCYCLGRTRGWILRGSTRWPRGWRGLREGGRTDQRFNLLRRMNQQRLMAVLSEVAAGPRSGNGCCRMKTQGWGSGRNMRRQCGCCEKWMQPRYP